MKKRLLYTILILIFGSLTGQANSGVVGAIPGHFAVSPSGSATYTIPIEVPPGINGMQPNISLVYNSHAGQGYLGWGWSLGGQSAISRTGKTLYHDGVVEGIQLDASDNLMLDGQRLIRIVGNSLTVGAEYRTEAETFSRITREFFGIHLGFKVETKQGLTLEYGSSRDSRLTGHDYRQVGLPGRAPISFLLERVIDANGNYMTYEYFKDDGSWGTGEVFLRRIRYGGNYIAGTPHFNEIEFMYTERPDIRSIYIGGTRIVTTHLLRQIIVKSNNNIVSRYELGYDWNNINSRLTSVTRINDSNERMPSTAILWGTRVETLTTNVFTSALQSEHLWYADFNGDGRTDMVMYYPSTGKLIFYLADGTTNLMHRWKEWEVPLNSNEAFHTIIPGDFDGDGLADFVLVTRRENNATNPTQSHVYHHVLYSNRVFEPRSMPADGGDFRETFGSVREYTVGIPGNFRGTGQLELLFRGTSSLHRLPASGSGVTELIGGNSTREGASIQWGTRVHTADFHNNRYLLDFNGDGKTDIMVLGSDGYRIYTVVRQNSNYIYELLHEGNYPNVNTGIYFGDFNGDGKTDFITQRFEPNNPERDNETVLHLSTGTDFHRISLPKHETRLFVGDFNGDGRSDIAYFTSATNLNIRLSNGRSLSEERRFTLSAGVNLSSLDRVIVTNFNGEGRDDITVRNGTNGIRSFTFGRNSQDLNVSRITDGLGQQINISYAPLHNADVYDPVIHIRPTFPLSRFNGNIRLVSSYSIGSFSESFRTTMKYTAARVHRQGKGFLGFEKTESRDVTSNVLTTTYFNHRNQFFHVDVDSITTSIGDTKLTTARFTNIRRVLNANQRRFFPFVSAQTTIDHLTGLSETTTSNLDANGNPQTITTVRGDIRETQTINYIQSGAWLPNKPSSIRTERTYHGEPNPNPVRVEFAYDNRGNLTRETRSHGSDPAHRLVTEYRHYNTFGQPGTIAVTAGGRTRTTTQTFSSSGRFMESSTNILGERTTYEWDRSTGLLSSATDHYGRTTSYTYDSFGRLIETLFPDGIRENTGLHWAGQNSPNGARYFSRSQVSGRAPVYVWFNDLGQEILQESYGLDNQRIRVFSEYNPQGRLWRVSAPTFGNNANNTWDAVYSYDQFGRVASIVTPMGTTGYTYSGLTTTVQTPEGTTSTTLNRSGLRERSTVNDKYVSYTYHPSGLLRTATPQNGLPVSMEYDPMGRRIKINDPNAGIVRSQYNGFGDLLWSSQRVHNSSDSVLTRYTYTNHGILQLVERRGQETEYIVYNYGSNRRVSSITLGKQGDFNPPIFPPGIITEQSNLIRPDPNDPVWWNNIALPILFTPIHRQEFTYDEFDRITKVREIIGDKTFDRATEFDNLGRVAREIYPTGFYARNFFDSHSNLIEIRDSQNRLIWQPLEENARRQIVHEKRGAVETEYGYDNRGFPFGVYAEGIQHNFYEFDSRGNLILRNDYMLFPFQEESFEYDNQNRLTAWTVTNDFTHVVRHSQTYDEHGNIRTRSGLDNLTMSYGEGNGKPHALTSIRGLTSGLPLTTLSVSYTDFKKVKTLEEIELGKRYEITYGMDNQRRKSVFSENGQTRLTRYYFGDYEEKIDHTSQITEKIHYLRGAVYITRSDSTSDFFYTYTDYLGSLTALRCSH